MFKPDCHELQELAASLLKTGYRVFCSRDPQWRSYLFVSDGTRIAYAQEDRFKGIAVSTVHKPNSLSGTGVMADFGNPLSSVEMALQGCSNLPPHAVTGGERYRDLEAFLKSRTASGGPSLQEVFPSDLALVPVAGRTAAEELEHLSRCVWTDEETDEHGLGPVGWEEG
jgi:hypothetical protein